jgi:hypothetical protein
MSRPGQDVLRRGSFDPAQMRRGVAFVSFHNAIWEQAVPKCNINPDKLSHDALAAELTSHLLDGALLIPGAVLPELQPVGFHYAT